MADFIRIEVLGKVFAVMYHDISNPKKIMEIGLNFIYWGKINRVWLTGGSHLIILPVQMDINARRIIGLIIALCSVILINAALDWVLHIVTMLNRIE